MKYLQPASLICLGCFWLFHSVFLQMATTTSAVSDAMQLESDLKSWADQKRKEGKLNNQDILEIFPEGYSLALGGENPNNNFREMIEDISKRNPLPVLPGFVSIAIGAFGLFTTATTQKADPDAVGNG